MRFTFAVVFLCCLASSTRAADLVSPNILFIAVDDLNHWVGYLGRNKQTKTPNIDRLAARGVAFSRSYCAAPACNPSRAALMSGLRPHSTGVYHNNNDWRPVVPVERTLVSALRTAGYYAAGAGKIYHGGFDRTSEFNDYFKGRGGRKAELEAGSWGFGNFVLGALKTGDDTVADYAITDYCIAQLGKKHEKPFFLACGLHKPHLPWNVPKKYFDMFPLDQIELPPHVDNDLADVPAAGKKIAKPNGDHATILKEGKWKKAVQAYLATIAYTDMNIGRLLDALDKSTYKDNTVIVFWGDHGWHLGEKEHWRKFALWEEATRAPLIWVVPGLTKPNSVCSRTVDFMSIYPTLCDVCGVSIPKHVEGASVKNLLVDPKAVWSTPALTTHGFKNHTIRSEGWRYIRYADGSEELYDEAKDPYEWKNLANQSADGTVKAELARQLPKTNTPEVSAVLRPK